VNIKIAASCFVLFASILSADNAQSRMAKITLEIVEDKSKIIEKYTDFEQSEIDEVYFADTGLLKIFRIYSQSLCSEMVCPTIIVINCSGDSTEKSSSEQGESVLRVFASQDVRGFTAIDFNNHFPFTIVFYKDENILGYVVYNQKTAFWVPSLLERN
tara:strand:+ start:60 stop:533 length:474 start_codon:yes stop_codon:yes gene_type:complete